MIFSFGSPDSKFAQSMETFADAVWLTILMILTSIPLITIGASLCAGHDAARRTEQGGGHITAAYFRAFASNFLESTIIWAVMGPILFAIIWLWLCVWSTPLLIIKFILSILWVIVAEWVFALQARFKNSIDKTVVNSLIFGISYWKETLIMTLLDIVFIVLIFASIVYLPQGLPLLVFIGWGSLIMLHTPILERVFAKYIKQE
ncbi:beta-carotene 15,15'-monooxygenase [Gardnerella leopoldii]|nr:beta-carotene 15,15'-monooxygenase [Gardnerella leopoldii]